MRKAVGRSVAVIVALVSMVAAFFVGTGAARMAYADTTSSNLKDFLTSVDISGITPDAQGVYHYRKGQEVALNFVFAEKGSGKLQFDNNSPLIMICQRALIRLPRMALLTSILKLPMGLRRFKVIPGK